MSTHKFVRPLLMGLASWGLVVLTSVEARSQALEEKSIPSHVADAEQGDVESQWFLGYLYSEGVRVEEYLEQSFRWTKPAAEATSVSTLLSLS